MVVQWKSRFLCVLLGLIATRSDAADPGSEAKPNRLARESSPYLLQYAQQPVNWYPWGEEAFDRAKREGKLVFLSSGFSSCHWCHVMAKESFADAAVAAILNEHFVCIKLDREERPDVDHIYMTALNVTGNRGGWPLSMFLTAEGRPIAGGTYWPREDREVQGQVIPGFKTILKNMMERYKEAPEEIQKNADSLAERTRRVVQSKLRLGAAVALDQSLVSGAVDEVKSMFDPEYGGFIGSILFRGPKFPKAPTLLFLQAEAKRSDDKSLREMLEKTLDSMSRGGIYDQIGGGFHRYAVERTWTVPHFEKMLPDSAQLLEVYASEYTRQKQTRGERVLRETAEFVKRELTSPEGGFYSSLDADSEGVEGKYYLWTRAEIDSALSQPEERALATKLLALDSGPNFEKTHYVLALSTWPAESELAVWKRIRSQLFETRSKRVRPRLDNKVLTSWNGQMIAGLACAGHALNDKEMTQMAARAARFILKTMKTSEGRLMHSYASVPGESAKARVQGMLEDYVFLVHGLLQLHKVTGERQWLDEAITLNDATVQWFEDETLGGYFATAHDHEKLFVRAKDQYDGSQPSGNSQVLLNAVRIWQVTREEKYRKQAERGLQALAPMLRDEPSSLCTTAEALSLYLQLQTKK